MGLLALIFGILAVISLFSGGIGPGLGFLVLALICGGLSD
jgi:hypothetical protein